MANKNNRASREAAEAAEEAAASGARLLAMGFEAVFMEGLFIRNWSASEPQALEWARLAAKAGQLNELKSLKGAFKGSGMEPEFQVSPLAMAAALGLEETVGELLRLGADPEGLSRGAAGVRLNLEQVSKKIGGMAEPLSQERCAGMVRAATEAKALERCAGAAPAAGFKSKIRV